MSKNSLILLVLLIVIIVIPTTVSANVLLEEHVEDKIVTAAVYDIAGAQTDAYFTDPPVANSIWCKYGSDLIGIQYMTLIVSGNDGKYSNGTFINLDRYETTYTCNGYTDTAIIYIDRTKNYLGQITSTKYTIFLENIDNAVSGHENSNAVITFSDFVYVRSTGGWWRYDNYNQNFYVAPTEGRKYNYVSTFGYTKVIEWQNDITVSSDMSSSYQINIKRKYDNNVYTSTLDVYDNNNNLVMSDTASVDKLHFFSSYDNIKSIKITSRPVMGQTGKNWTFYIPEIDVEPPVTPSTNKTFSVFVRDGNTYEPIHESVVSFKNYNSNEWILNKTIYNGYGSVSLPYGWYYAYVNASGYYQPHPVQMVVDDSLVSSTFNIYQIGDIPEPEEPTEFLDLTVSVKNSQTGALIGGSEIGIRRYGDTGFYQNLTLSSGYTTIFLPPANYEIFAEAPGYYQVYPARITLDQPHENIGVFLQPTTPIPEEGNVTLNLWVCYIEPGSGQAAGIPYADILISGISGDGIGYSSGSLITDMGGYLTLDIPANTEYIAYAEKPGYLAGSTHFTVFNVSPVNMTIQMIREIPPTVPVVTPPPTIPTLPTPTEPLGFMDQSGKALGDLFGVSLSIGKMMLGVLISLAVGMGTAKNLKGGAPEFCVGFLGAAFLVTMADLIPVGFFVAMLLLMGIYIARAYFLGGENGG